MADRIGTVADQRATWTDQAEAWDRWADRTEKMAERFNQPLAELAAAKPGDRVLDLASGVGEPGLTIAKAIQPGGRLILTDLVPEMLSGAARRFRARGIDAGFVVQDAQRLAIADRSVDLVTCRFGIMFFPEPRVALAEVFRVLVPGGRAAFVVWAGLADNPMFEVTRAAIDAVLGSQPPPFDPFRHAEPGVLAPDFAASGFTAYAEKELGFERHAKAGEPFWRAPLEMTGGSRLSALDEATRTRLDDEVLKRMAPYRDGDGYTLKTRIRILTAMRPS